MKRYFNILLTLTTALLVAAAFTGCADEVDVDPVRLSETNTINLKVDVPVKNASRSATDPLNEFTVQSLHLYFFAKADHNDATSEYLFDYTVSDVFEVQRKLAIPLPSNSLSAGGLFGTDGTECIVYAVANVDESKLTSKTIEGLKATVVDSEFDKTKIQDRFAMDGQSTLTLTSRENRTVTGTITLQRAAAKLTLAIDVPATIDVTETINNSDGTVTEIKRKYTPLTDQMHVWMANGVKTSVLNIAPTPAAKENLYSNNITIAEGVGSAFKPDAAQTKYKYVQDIPFYSYPNQWEQYDLNGNSYLTLEIPWTYEDRDNSKHNVVTYYRISVQPEKCFIERNMHYDMRVTISRLGSISKQTPTDILVDWAYILPWNDQQLVTDIKDIRYLLLNNNDYDENIIDTQHGIKGAYAYTMNNQTDIEIPISTSHNVMIESVILTWHDFLNNVDRTITLTADGDNKYSTISGYNPTSIIAGIEVDNEKAVLRLTRDMLHITYEVKRVWVKDDSFWGGHYEDQIITSPTTNPALNTYRFDIKLRHIDDASQTANVRITQIPAIYITSLETPSGTRFINKNNDSYNIGTNRNPNYKGYVSTGDNLPNNATQRQYYLGSKHDGNNYVKNKHTYILTITRFDESETKEYIIADPRTRKVNNLPVSGSETAAAGWSMPGGDMQSANANRQLRNYFPADPDPDAKKKRYIAPQLRIASQWGVTYDVTRDGAIRRCASYQENGRPAGRWRLPTVAEIEYIANLSSKGYIPYLFGSANEDADYWCASGAVDVKNTSNPPYVEELTSDDARAVRCVYDEWYWGTDTLTNKNTFTWGDRPRSNSGNNPNL